MIEGTCEQCGYSEDFHHWTLGDGVWHRYTCDEVERRSDELADRLARVFQRWLEEHYPDKRWVRVRHAKDRV